MFVIVIIENMMFTFNTVFSGS